MIIIRYWLLIVLSGLFFLSVDAMAASCPCCGQNYGAAAPGDEARVYGLRQSHEASCCSSSGTGSAGTQFFLDMGRQLGNELYRMQQEQEARRRAQEEAERRAREAERRAREAELKRQEEELQRERERIAREKELEFNVRKKELISTLRVGETSILQSRELELRTLPTIELRGDTPRLLREKEQGGPIVNCNEIGAKLQGLSGVGPQQLIDYKR